MQVHLIFKDCLKSDLDPNVLKKTLDQVHRVGIEKIFFADELERLGESVVNALVVEGKKGLLVDWPYLMGWLSSRESRWRSPNFLSVHFYGYRSIKSSKDIWVPDEKGRAARANSNFVDGGEFLGLSFWKNFRDFKNDGPTEFAWMSEVRESFQERAPQEVLFLDRDGVINVDHGYIEGPGRVEIYPKAYELISLASDHQRPVVVVTNQSGVARGFFDLDAVNRVHDFIREEVYRETKIEIQHWLSSPYHEQEGKGAWRRPSFCRKPGPGLFLKACKEQGFSLKGSLMVGDKGTDRPQGIDLSSMIQENEKTLSTKGSKFRDNLLWDNYAPVLTWRDHRELIRAVENFLTENSLGR